MKNVNLAAATIRSFIFSIEMKNAEHKQAITFFTMSSQVGPGFHYSEQGPERWNISQDAGTKNSGNL